MELIKIKKKLDELKPYKAILFGSHAYGIPHENSDIDLIVVLDKDEMPKNFSERIKNYSQVKKYFKSVIKDIPMDILVYTKQEWNHFIKSDSSFSREILTKGKLII